MNSIFFGDIICSPWIVGTGVATMLVGAWVGALTVAGILDVTWTRTEGDTDERVRRFPREI